MDGGIQALTASQRREAASLALDELLQLVATQQIATAWLIRHLTQVYWNMGYIEVDTPLVARIEAAKAKGVEWQDFKDALFERYRGQDALDGGRRCAAYHAALAMIPDRLLDANKDIVWISERPHHTFVPLRLRQPPSPSPDQGEPVAAQDPSPEPTMSK